MSRENARSQDHWDEPPEEEIYERPVRPVRPRRPPRRQRGPWLWLLTGCASGIFAVVLTAAIIIFLAVRGATGGSIGGIGNLSTYTQSKMQQFQLTSLTQLQVHDQIGSVTITEDPSASALTVTTTKKVKANNNNDANKEFGRISAQVRPGDTTLTVDATVPDSSGSLLGNHNDSVDVTITVPTSLTTPAATTSAAAPLMLNVDTSVGDVRVTGLSGVLTIKDHIGNVTVRQAVLADGSHLQTSTGNATFAGTLDTSMTISNSSPRYKIQSEVGNVDVTLPATTNAILDAATNVGKINSEFAISVQNNDNGASFYGPLIPNTNPPPSAVLALSVGQGNVNLHVAT